MKKGIELIVTILIVAVAVVVGVKMFVHNKEAKYAATAVPYVEKVVPEISKWDAATVKKYMAEETLSKLSDEKIEQILASLSRLGALKKVGKPVFQSADTYKTKGGKEVTTVAYKVSTEYEQGAAEISIGLLANGDSYQIENFNFSSPLLSK